MELYNIGFEAYGITQKGCYRSNNEDNYQIGSHYKNDTSSDEDSCICNHIDGKRYSLFSVFDGMGGGPYGEQASLYAAQEACIAYMRLNDEMSCEVATEVVKEFFQSANNRIVRDMKGILGTTGVSVLLDRIQKKVKFFWSGDSRGYLYRDGFLLRLTQDQSIAAICLKNGCYKKTDSQYNIDRKRLTGYIGKDLYCYSLKLLESSWIALSENDKIVLVTDGVYESCDDKDIQGMMNVHSKVKQCCDGILAMSVRNQAQDDMSIVIIAILNLIEDTISRGGNRFVEK